MLLGQPDAIRDKLIATLTVLGKLDPATVGTIDVRAPADPVTQPPVLCRPRRTHPRRGSLTPGSA